MAIKISGTTVIDDSRNLVSVGVATVGSGNSAVILNGNSRITNIGSGVTINGNTGDINISGILTVGQLNIPIQVSSFDPAIGATSVGIASNIVLNFNQTVGFGTTGFVEIKVGTSRTEIMFQGSSRITLTSGGTRLTIDPTNNLPNGINTITTVMSSGFVVANGNNFAGINTVGSATTYSFTTKQLALGDVYEGGNLICQSGGVRWVVSPSSTQIARDWYSRNDAITCTASVTGCTGWFVPTFGQLQNPGYVCRTFWDSFLSSPSRYWSNTEVSASDGCTVSFNPPFGTQYGPFSKSFTANVRTFRCVAY